MKTKKNPWCIVVIMKRNYERKNLMKRYFEFFFCIKGNFNFPSYKNAGGMQSREISFFCLKFPGTKINAEQFHEAEIRRKWQGKDNT